MCSHWGVLSREVTSLGSCQNRTLATRGPGWKQGSQRGGNYNNPGENNGGVGQDDSRERTGCKGSESACVVKAEPTR